MTAKKKESDEETNAGEEEELKLFKVRIGFNARCFNDYKIRAKNQSDAKEQALEEFSDTEPNHVDEVQYIDDSEKVENIEEI